MRPLLRRCQRRNGDDDALLNIIYGRCGHDALWRIFC